MHSARVPSQDDVLQAFKRAGFASFTPLQQRLIPLVLKNRDVVAPVPGGGGTTTGIVAPLLLSLRGAGPSLRALILLPTVADVGKVARAATRFTRVIHDAPEVMSLGEIEDARRESRRLEKGAAIVAGTVERVIDHIRRGGLSFNDLQTVVVREPEAAERADFVKDVQFIFAKWTVRPRIILLARAALTEEDELGQLLHHPLTLGGEEKETSTPAVHLVFGTDGKPLADALLRVILGMRLPPVVVFYSPRADVRGMLDALRARGLRAVLLPAGGRQGGDRSDALRAFARRALDAVFVPLGAGAVASDLEETASSQVVFLDPPTGPVRSPGGLLKRAGVIVLADRERDLTRLQEAIGVPFDKKDMPGDEEVLTGAIDRVLRRMKDEDKAELALLRARIRRQVPLLLRPLFMASLLKSQLPAAAGLAGIQSRSPTGTRQRAATVGPQPSPAPVPGVPPRGQRGRFGRSVQEPGAGRPPRAAETQRAPRPTGEFTQLFVSIGRNRRVYARDLTELFTEKLQLTAGDIGGVRVFDKYSFVDIVPGKAEDAISRLSGTELKGRPITVNYAKKKEEKEEK